MLLHEFCTPVYFLSFAATPRLELGQDGKCLCNQLTAVYIVYMYVVPAADLHTLHISTAGMTLVTVHAGQDGCPLHPTAHHTSPNTFECTIQDGIIQANKDYRVVVNCNNQSVDVSFTAVKYSCKYIYSTIMHRHAKLSNVQS